MDWLHQLIFTPGLANTVILYSFIIAAGVWLGKRKIFGISLGVTFVLFVGIVVGHFTDYFSINKQVLDFAKELGLILFVYSIGLQVGPGFFSSFKKGGMLLNLLALGVILLNIATVIVIYYVTDARMEDLVGVLSGAVTNTPGLGAAQQALEQLGKAADIPSAAAGYAAAYPLGVVGIILSMIVIKKIFRISTTSESKQIEEENEASILKPMIVSLRVENKMLDGKTLKQIIDFLGRDFVISRIKKAGTGEVIIPRSTTVINAGDYMILVLSPNDEEAVEAFIGERVEMDWDAIDAPVVSRRILITKPEYNGRSISSLKLHAGFQLNATRVNRAGMDLVAAPNLKLQMGDRITVVGKLEDINRLADRMGNSMKRLNEPNMITIFVGILLGIILGSIPFYIPGMSTAMKLGLAGGPLIAAILIGRFGYKLKLITYTSTSSSLMLREIGICLFLASVGFTAGGSFVDTIVSGDGLWWVLWGFLITTLPLLVIGTIARAKFKINYCTLMGLMSGSTTDPPALAYANKTANNDAPAVAYSTVYPLTMFMRVLTAQILILIFCA
ncbi:MAG: putative transporter [Bacteroidales bacterium]|nr:putative transporter [Bacteroidales bacterium]